MLDFAVKITDEPWAIEDEDRERAAPRRLLGSRYLGHRGGRRLLQHVEPRRRARPTCGRTRFIMGRGGRRCTRQLSIASGTDHLRANAWLIAGLTRALASYRRNRTAARQPREATLKTLAGGAIAAVIAMAQHRADPVVSEDIMVKSPDAGSRSSCATSARPNMTSFRPERTRALRARRDLSGARPPSTSSSTASRGWSTSRRAATTSTCSTCAATAGRRGRRR